MLTSLEKKPSKGTALTLLVPTLARAISYRRKRQTAFALATCLQASGRGSGELTLSQDSHGMPLRCHARHGVTPCVWDAHERLGRSP